MTFEVAGLSPTQTTDSIPVMPDARATVNTA